MPEGAYTAPDTIEAAVKALGESGSGRVMAGGTDLLVQLHSDLADPDLIIDIKHLPGLRDITQRDDGYRIGAALSGMALMADKEFAAAWPGIIEGVALIGSVQVKARASLGGNLCNASPAADSVPAMIAAGAVAEIAGPQGIRKAPVEDIVTGPGQTSLGRGEFIVAFELPARPACSGDCYMRLTPRTEMDIAVVGAGVNLTLGEDGICTAARVALGAVAPRPLLVGDAGAALVGTKVDDAALGRMVEAVRAACDPISDKRGTRNYRIKTAGVMARRVAEVALKRAQAA